MVPTMPCNWVSLLELLTKIDDLRDLYRIAWQRFDVLEEDQRPIRGEIYRLRENVAHVQASLDGIANETIHACKPLIHNLYQHFATRLEGIEERLHVLDGGAWIVVGPREPGIGDVLKEVTRLSARMDALEQTVGDRLKMRIEVTLSNYLSQLGLTQDVLRELGSTFGHPSLDIPVGGSISDVLHTVYPGQQSGGTIPSSSAPTAVTLSASSSVRPSTLGSFGMSALTSIATSAPEGIPVSSAGPSAPSAASTSIRPSTRGSLHAPSSSRNMFATQSESAGMGRWSVEQSLAAVGQGAAAEHDTSAPAPYRLHHDNARKTGGSSDAGRGAKRK